MRPPDTESQGLPSAMPFQDPDLDTEARIDDLVARLTLDEKVACLSTRPSVPRLGVLASGHAEGLHGLALGGPGGWGRDDPLPTTTFPQAVGLAQTWDPKLVRQVAELEAREARYYFHRLDRGALVIRAPNADLARDPRWGRSEESYGEDPFLTATMAVAFVRGLQGTGERPWPAAALLKHFLANSNEDTRTHSSSDFPERQFYEYYALPFQRAIQEGGARAVMAAYNAYHGVPCAVHPVLREVLVARWGEDGIVCTDGGAYRMLVEDHRYFHRLADAAAACVKAGINQFLDDFAEGVRQALDEKLLDESDLDAALRGSFRVMIRLGLLDPKERVEAADVPEQCPSELQTTRDFVRNVTCRSIVLLKNEQRLLPLDPGRAQRIAVVGPLADRVQLDWYSGTPPYLVTPLDGIKGRVCKDVEIRLVANNDTGALLRAARWADVCIVCVGNHPTGDAEWAKVTRPSYGREAVDRQSLELEDERLVQRVFEINENTVLVLISSFPYAICWSQEHVPAILHVTHNSQELGNALARVLFGDENPGGRLVRTWPRSLEQLPRLLDYDITRGRTHMYFEGEPLYPFGFGLSYTRFEYSDLRTSARELTRNAALSVSVTLTNVGEREGDDVVQLYASFPASRVVRPKQTLVAFERVRLSPGESRRVSLVVKARELEYWDEVRHAPALEPGPLTLRICRSATDVVLEESIDVKAA